MGLKLSIKKPFGGSNSFVRRNISKPGNLLAGSMLGMGSFGAGLGAGLTDLTGNYRSKMEEYQRQAGSAGGGDDFDSMARMDLWINLFR